MLLRRFSNHFRRQDWFAVVLDLLVVVLGIVIGLQASQWNQSRIDQREEIKYLLALDADLDDSHAFLSAQPTRNRIRAKYIASTTAKRELVKVEAKLVEVLQLLRERIQRVKREE
jgi:hypothetical protein